MSVTVQDRDIFIMKDNYKLVHNLLNCGIANDLK